MASDIRLLRRRVQGSRRSFTIRKVAPKYQVHVFGHSWGTVLAQIMGIEQYPRIKSIAIGGAFSDSTAYIQGQWETHLSTLPKFTQELLHEADKTGNYDNPTYAAICDALTHAYTIRTLPIPDCGNFEPTCNSEIYTKMQGASEFTVGGVLSNWNVTGDLHKIQHNVLVSHGYYGTMVQSVVEIIADQIPNALPVVSFPHAGHISMVDDNKLFCEIHQKFFLDNDAIDLPKQHKVEF